MVRLAQDFLRQLIGHRLNVICLASFVESGRDGVDCQPIAAQRGLRLSAADDVASVVLVEVLSRLGGRDRCRLHGGRAGGQMGTQFGIVHAS